LSKKKVTKEKRPSTSVVHSKKIPESSWTPERFVSLSHCVNASNADVAQITVIESANFSTLPPALSPATAQRQQAGKPCLWICA